MRRLCFSSSYLDLSVDEKPRRPLCYVLGRMNGYPCFRILRRKDSRFLCLDRENNELLLTVEQLQVQYPEILAHFLSETAKDQHSADDLRHRLPNPPASTTRTDLDFRMQPASTRHTSFYQMSPLHAKPSSSSIVASSSIPDRPEPTLPRPRATDLEDTTMEDTLFHPRSHRAPVTRGRPYFDYGHATKHIYPRNSHFPEAYYHGISPRNPLECAYDDPNSNTHRDFTIHVQDSPRMKQNSSSREYPPQSHISHEKSRNRPSSSATVRPTSSDAVISTTSNSAPIQNMVDAASPHRATDSMSSQREDHASDYYSPRNAASSLASPRHARAHRHPAPLPTDAVTVTDADMTDARRGHATGPYRVRSGDTQRHYDNRSDTAYRSDADRGDGDMMHPYKHRREAPYNPHMSIPMQYDTQSKPLHRASRHETDRQEGCHSQDDYYDPPQRYQPVRRHHTPHDLLQDAAYGHAAAYGYAGDAAYSSHRRYPTVYPPQPVYPHSHPYLALADLHTHAVARSATHSRTPYHDDDAPHIQHRRDYSSQVQRRDYSPQQPMHRGSYPYPGQHQRQRPSVASSHRSPPLDSQYSQYTHYRHAVESYSYTDEPYLPADRREDPYLRHDSTGPDNQSRNVPASDNRDSDGHAERNVNEEDPVDALPLPAQTGDVRAVRQVHQSTAPALTLPSSPSSAMQAAAINGDVSAQRHDVSAQRHDVAATGVDAHEEDDSSMGVELEDASSKRDTQSQAVVDKIASCADAAVGPPATTTDETHVAAATPLVTHDDRDGMAETIGAELETPSVQIASVCDVDVMSSSSTLDRCEDMCADMSTRPNFKANIASHEQGSFSPNPTLSMSRVWSAKDMSTRIEGLKVYSSFPGETVRLRVDTYDPDRKPHESAADDIPYPPNVVTSASSLASTHNTNILPSASLPAAFIPSASIPFPLSSTSTSSALASASSTFPSAAACLPSTTASLPSTRPTPSLLSASNSNSSTALPSFAASLPLYTASNAANALYTASNTTNALYTESNTLYSRPLPPHLPFYLSNGFTSPLRATPLTGGVNATARAANVSVSALTMPSSTATSAAALVATAAQLVASSQAESAAPLTCAAAQSTSAVSATNAVLSQSTISSALASAATVDASASNRTAAVDARTERTNALSNNALSNDVAVWSNTVNDSQKTTYATAEHISRGDCAAVSDVIAEFDGHINTSAPQSIYPRPETQFRNDFSGEKSFIFPRLNRVPSTSLSVLPAEYKTTPLPYKGKRKHSAADVLFPSPHKKLVFTNPTLSKARSYRVEDTQDSQPNRFSPIKAPITSVASKYDPLSPASSNSSKQTPALLRSCSNSSPFSHLSLSTSLSNIPQKYTAATNALNSLLSKAPLNIESSSASASLCDGTPVMTSTATMSQPINREMTVRQPPVSMAAFPMDPTPLDMIPGYCTAAGQMTFMGSSATDAAGMTGAMDSAGAMDALCLHGDVNTALCARDASDEQTIPMMETFAEDMAGKSGFLDFSGESGPSRQMTRSITRNKAIEGENNGKSNGNDSVKDDANRSLSEHDNVAAQSTTKRCNDTGTIVNTEQVAETLRIKTDDRWRVFLKEEVLDYCGLAEMANKLGRPIDDTTFFLRLSGLREFGVFIVSQFLNLSAIQYIKLTRVIVESNMAASSPTGITPPGQPLTASGPQNPEGSSVSPIVNEIDPSPILTTASVASTVDGTTNVMCGVLLTINGDAYSVMGPEPTPASRRRPLKASKAKNSDGDQNPPSTTNLTMPSSIPTTSSPASAETAAIYPNPPLCYNQHQINLMDPYLLHNMRSTVLTAEDDYNGNPPCLSYLIQFSKLTDIPFSKCMRLRALLYSKFGSYIEPTADARAMWRREVKDKCLFGPEANEYIHRQSIEYSEKRIVNILVDKYQKEEDALKQLDGTTDVASTSNHMHAVSPSHVASDRTCDNQAETVAVMCGPPDVAHSASTSSKLPTHLPTYLQTPLPALALTIPPGNGQAMIIASAASAMRVSSGDGRASLDNRASDDHRARNDASPREDVPPPHDEVGCDNFAVNDDSAANVNDGERRVISVNVAVNDGSKKRKSVDIGDGDSDAVLPSVKRKPTVGALAPESSSTLSTSVASNGVMRKV